MSVFHSWLEKFLKMYQLNVVFRYSVAPARHLGHRHLRLVSKEVMGIQDSLRLGKSAPGPISQPCPPSSLGQVTDEGLT